MEYELTQLSHSEVQEVAEFLVRYADRRRDDSVMAEAARNTIVAENAQKDSDRMQELLVLMMPQN